MIIKARGRIANISSVSGHLSGAFNGLYGMTKHALEAFNDSLTGELEDFGVSVSSIMPGNYNSRLGKNMLARTNASSQVAPASLYEEQITRRRAFFAQNFSGKLEEPDQVAEAVYHAMTAFAPRGRYLVVPSKRESWRFRGRILRRVLGMSASHNPGH